MLISLLEGTAPGERLKALLNEFNGIGETVESVYDVSATCTVHLHWETFVVVIASYVVVLSNKKADRNRSAIVHAS